MKQRQFESLVGPYLPDLFRLAYRFTGNNHDAEDLIQCVLLKLYPKVDELGTIERLKPWLAKVLYREFVDDKRRQNRWLTLVEPIEDGRLDNDYRLAMESTADAPDYLYGREEKIAQLEQALSTLNRDQQTLIVLHDIEGYTMKELTRILDVPAGTIKSRLHRARERLRACLDREPEPFSQRVNG